MVGNKKTSELEQMIRKNIDATGTESQSSDSIPDKHMKVENKGWKMEVTGVYDIIII